ncbi:MAG TPA: hypothetical protein VLK85_12995 [Ramlibacter sp.]|nr:hypothetical protein [Ramlibacter sp.]
MSEQGRTQELLLLGQIHGLVQSLKDGQDLTNRRIESMEKRVDERFDGIDQRLRTVEQKAAVIGAASGGAMALGTALIVEGIKNWLGRHGG